MTNRPSKRTLVRWNDDHDKELLLWIVYCCNESGIKIPFARIAQCMGASFTEGACIQHLAKIRNKMEEAGLHVPPTQKRGTVTRTGSSIYRPKPKDAKAPVPRVRPDTAPAPCMSGAYDDDDDDDDDEDSGEHLDFGEGRTNKTQGIKHLPLGPAHQRRRQTSLKLDSEDDDALPPLYDSDNEYGAKKPKPSPSKSITSDTHKVQVKLNFGDNLQKLTLGADQEDIGSTIAGQGRSNSMKSGQLSPGLKYESLDTSMAEYTAQPGRPQPRGVRRKMSAFDTNDDEDDEYDPGTKGKGRSKKPRPSRAVKKQKVEDKVKTKAGSEKQKKESIARDTDLDRVAMPPPPANPHYTSEFGGAWNTSFMQNPFATTDFGFNGGDHNDGAFNDFSPATQYNNLGFQSGPNFSNPTFNAYQQPSYSNYGSRMPPNASASNTRNHSFASVDSTSTIESQPVTWNQPYRTPGFPNPREASMTLYDAITQPGADAQTKINIYQAPPLGIHSGGGPGFGFDMDDSLLLQGGVGETPVSEHDSVVPELPQMPEDNFNFSQFLAEEYI